MPSIKIEEPKSIPEFLQIIETFRKKSAGPLFFRGCGKESFVLKPTLYRHNRIKTIEKLLQLEENIISRFKQRSLPFMSTQFSDDLILLFFIQHYGIPTRLLDWTENPLIALHFALMDAWKFRSLLIRREFKEDACVWLLDPVAWNRNSLRFQSFKGGILSIDDEQIKGYRPHEKYTTMNSYPIAIYGAHNSARIVAQQGVFTIFGQDNSSMDSIVTTDDAFTLECLLKIRIKKEYIEQMKVSLLQIGITETVVFPDLEGLALETKRQFGFMD